MPTRLSPGVFLNEFDFSELKANLGTTRVAIVGGASKGEIGKPIVATSEADLIAKVGAPLLNDQGIISALQYLQHGRQIVYLRVANLTDVTYGAQKADRTLSGITGGTDAVAATGSISFDASANPTDGETVAVNDGASAVPAKGKVTFNAQTDDGDYLHIDDGQGVAGGASVNHSALPTDGDTITITDAFGGSVVFEYDTNASVGGGNTAVDISSTTTNGADELETAINGSALLIDAVATVNVVALTHQHTGLKGNNSTLATAGATPPAISGANFTGGNAHAVTFEFDSNSTTTTGSTGVTIGGTIAATLYNLIQAINAATTLEITASDNTVANSGIPQVLLTHDAAGTASNSASLSKIDGDADLTLVAFVGGSNGAPVTFEFDSNAAFTPGNVPVLIGATAAATMANLIAAISANTNIAAVDNTVTVPAAALTHNVPGSLGNQTITETAANITVAGMAGGSQAVPGPSGAVLTIAAISEGTWGNGIEIVTQATAVNGASAISFDLIVRAVVDDSGTKANVERYENVNLDADSDRYLPLVLEEGLLNEVGPSEYITATVVSDSGLPIATTVSLGVSGGNAGRNGIVDGSGNRIITASDIIGSLNGNTSTGLQSLANNESTRFNLLMVPGISHRDVVSAMVSLVEARGDAVALIDPPFDLSRDDVIAWHNGVYAGPNAPTAPIDSSYAFISWPWKRVTDSYNKRRVWVAPSGSVAAACAYTDRVAGPQYAISGHNRGVVKGEKLEYSPSLADRDLLAGGQNKVNPWVSFEDTGITLMNQRTALRRSSSLQSMHVRRMLIEAETLVAAAVKYLVFEPHDPVTWRRFEQLCNPILANLQANRGLETFEVVCNLSTNPVNQRRLRIMRGKIRLVPIETAEIIEVDFNVYQTGTTEFTEPV